MKQFTEEKIYSIFNEIGFKKTKSGYFLWASFIIYVYNNIHCFLDLANIEICKLYKEFATTIDSSDTKLERNLRNLLKEKKEDIQEYFNYSGKIDNKTFLIIMLEKLKMEENNDTKRSKKTNGKRTETVL